MRDIFLDIFASLKVATKVTSSGVGLLFTVYVIGSFSPLAAILVTLFLFVAMMHYAIDHS